jgi:hypothetical protein
VPALAARAWLPQVQHLKRALQEADDLLAGRQQ